MKLQMAKQKFIVGIDIGGTTINAILMDRKARIIKKIKVPTPKRKNDIIRKIVECAKYVMTSFNKKEIAGIGIGVPGPLNQKKDLILKPGNLPALKYTKLPSIIQQKTNLKTVMENDAACATLAESRFGSCKEAKSLVCLTLGTGVGGGIIINGRLYSGRGNAPEPGHLTIDKTGKKCTCGSIGCLEEYVSIRGLRRIAKKFGLAQTDPRAIERLAQAGNKKAKAVYKEFGMLLGIGLSDIAKMLDPEVIILCGGLSEAASLFLPAAKKEMRKRTPFKPCNVRASTLEDGGAIGAACLLLYA